jgi:hypothetical protein
VAAFIGVDVFTILLKLFWWIVGERDDRDDYDD